MRIRAGLFWCVYAGILVACGAEAPPVGTVSEPFATPVNALGVSRIRPQDEMVVLFVPGGTFSMGIEEAEVDQALALCLSFSSNCARRYFDVEMPLHDVTLDSFWIDQTEVTLDRYQRCIEAGLCSPVHCDPELLGSGDHPVACVT